VCRHLRHLNSSWPFIHYKTLVLSDTHYTHIFHIKPIFSPSQFKALIIATKVLPLSQFCNLAYIWAFTALLHISNLAPQTRSAFDPRRHIRRGDITITPNGLSIFIRWTNTLQHYNQTAHIQFFAVPNSPLCPLLAFKPIQHLFPSFPLILSYLIE
jgi:hypothetical protein